MQLNGRGAVLILAGCALIVAPFLPAISASAVLAGSVDASILDVSGGEALLLALLGAIVVAVGWPALSTGRHRRGPLAIVGVLGGVYGIYLYREMAARVEDFGTDIGFASVGAGIYVMLVASLVVFAGAFAKQQRPAEEERTPNTAG